MTNDIKFQFPSTNFQINSKFQLQKTNLFRAYNLGIYLEIGACDLELS